MDRPERILNDHDAYRETLGLRPIDSALHRVLRRRFKRDPGSISYFKEKLNAIAESGETIMGRLIK